MVPCSWTEGVLFGQCSRSRTMERKHTFLRSAYITQTPRWNPGKEWTHRICSATTFLHFAGCSVSGSWVGFSATKEASSVHGTQPQPPSTTPERPERPDLYPHPFWEVHWSLPVIAKLLIRISYCFQAHPIDITKVAA